MDILLTALTIPILNSLLTPPVNKDIKEKFEQLLLDVNRRHPFCFIPTLKITGLLLHKFHLNMSHKIKVGVPEAPLLISSLFTTLSLGC